MTRDLSDYRPELHILTMPIPANPAAAIRACRDAIQEAKSR